MIRTLTPPISEVNDPPGRGAQHRRAAVGVQPDQELGPGRGDFAQEVPAVKAAVHQHQHGGIQQGSRLPAQVISPWPVDPDTAPSSARVPVSTSVMSWMTG